MDKKKESVIFAKEGRDSSVVEECKEFRGPLKIPHHRRMAHQTRSFSRSKGSALRQGLWQTACFAPPFTTVTKERKQALCCARPASSPMLRQLTLVPYSKVWLGFRSSLPQKIPSSGIKSEAILERGSEAEEYFVVL